MSEQPKRCDWTRADDEADLWDTTCGNVFQFTDGGPKTNQFRFCCYCGGLIWMRRKDRKA